MYARNLVSILRYRHTAVAAPETTEVFPAQLIWRTDAFHRRWNCWGWPSAKRVHIFYPWHLPESWVSWVSWVLFWLPEFSAWAFPCWNRHMIHTADEKNLQRAWMWTLQKKTCGITPSSYSTWKSCCKARAQLSISSMHPMHHDLLRGNHPIDIPESQVIPSGNLRSLHEHHNFSKTNHQIKLNGPCLTMF
jgi:hypothetical protein